MKRLFITTGLISLVNALVIIRQNPIESDDTLAIISFNQSEDFVETQKKIASLHGFSNIVFVKKQKDIFKVFNLNQFDKLYVTSLTNLYKKCNRHKECYFFDEGPGYAFADVSDCRNVKAYCTTNFLNKFSFAKQVKSIPTLELSKDIFCQVSREISEKFNLHDKLNTSKNILFIGHYICREFGNEKALAFYKKYIDYFINLGYNIYFIFDKKFTRKEMFTFEKGVDPLHPEDKDLQFLCGWEKDCHVNYGKVPFDQAEVLMRCFQIYKTKHNIK